MNIRFATSYDAKAIAKNNIMLAKETENLVLDENQAIIGTQMLLDKENKYGFYLIVEDKEDIIGQMLITTEWSDWRNKEIWWIHRIYVEKKHRNTGIFTQMVQRLWQLAQQKQVYAIRLYVHENNTFAQIVYSTMEFTQAPFIIYQKFLD